MEGIGMTGTVRIIAGGQYGSEAKGAVTAALIDRHKTNTPQTTVRVAGPNAGHTAYDANGRAWALRQIPVGAVVDLDAQIIIAEGSELDLPVVLSEINDLENAGIPILERLHISDRATLLTDHHHQIEQQSDLNARAGSTAKGIGAARAERIMRRAWTPRTAASNHDLNDFYLENWKSDEARQLLDQVRPNWAAIFAHDTTKLLKQNLMQDGDINIEGTQGYGLGLHGQHYPQCTSSNTRALDFLAMTSLNPWDTAVRSIELWLAVRAYPIRVAGNSGPLHQETTWEALGLPRELTTVTKKTRRVGHWDQKLFWDAINANGGAFRVNIAYSMADQEHPALAGLDGDYEKLARNLDDDQNSAISRIVQRTLGTVRYIGTGPNSRIWIDNPRRFSTNFA